MATIADVAAIAGVSRATVSRVLNGNPCVDPVLTKKVTAAVKKLKYKPSRVARSLRNGRSTVLGVIISDIRNPVYTELFRGIEDIAYAEGFSVVLCNSFDSVERESDLLHMAAAERFAGVLMVSAPGGGGQISGLLHADIPVVAMDRKVEGADVDTVLVDNVKGAIMAVEHLLDQGYQRIGYLSGPTTIYTGAQRLAGYQAALASRRIRLATSLIRYCDFHEATAKAATKQLLAKRPGPDAIFSANGMMTAGALEAIAEAGRVIPDHIAVLSFDESPWSRLVTPPLTTIEQPVFDMGREAVQLLLGRIRGYRGSARELTLAPSLNVRASTRARA